MKRFTAAALAAATAMSLAVAPAQAADDYLYLRGLNKPGGSSSVTNQELGAYMISAAVVEEAREANLTNNKGATSSIRDMAERDEDKFSDATEGALNSSFKNDANNGYALGTTFEILLGTGIAAAVLAVLGGAAYAGVIPGVQLPALPF